MQLLGEGKWRGRGRGEGAALGDPGQGCGHHGGWRHTDGMGWDGIDYDPAVAV